MSTKQDVVLNANRVGTLGLTFTGLLLDGYQLSDLLCLVALVGRLWLPFWTQFEVDALVWLQAKVRLGLRRNEADEAPPQRGVR